MGKVLKGLIAVMVIMVIVSAFIFYTTINLYVREHAQQSIVKDEMLRRINKITTQQSQVHLSELTPFIWDEAYSIRGYAEKKDAVAFLGDKSSFVNILMNEERSIVGSDMGRWVIFFEGERMVMDSNGYEWYLMGEQFQKVTTDEAWLLWNEKTRTFCRDNGE